MTEDTRKVMIVIPAYNESTVVGSVVERVRRVCPAVVVVDDGSSDGTGDVARVAGATVVRHAINLGQGAALQTGITYALRAGATHIVTFDADGQHDPGDIDTLVSALVDARVDVALGSRFAGTTVDMPRSRRALLQVARLVNFALTGLMLSDAHNGVRAFSRHAAEQLHIYQSGMAHATEIVAQIARRRLRFVEVPVTVHYTEYSLAKGQKLSNSFHILMDLLLSGLQR
jgi:polyprenyl-phospho-N-acetylgalactosaminyl synthase